MKQKVREPSLKKEKNFNKENVRKWTIDELMELGRS